VTERLYYHDCYLREFKAKVVDSSDGGRRVYLDRTAFYPTSGGQPFDLGTLAGIAVREVIDEDDRIGHLLEAPLGAIEVTGVIDWDRRYDHMQQHTGQHLLSAVLPYPVTGGSVGEAESRLDFDIPDAGLDKDAITAKLAEMIATGAAVSSRWITDAELEANPGLIKTMSVKPPMGIGRVRLIEIAGLDLQPCGGTHVRSTAEIGAVRVTQVEKKGKLNRRVRLALV